MWLFAKDTAQNMNLPSQKKVSCLYCCFYSHRHMKHQSLFFIFQMDFIAQYFEIKNLNLEKQIPPWLPWYLGCFLFCFINVSCFQFNVHIAF